MDFEHILSQLRLIALGGSITVAGLTLMLWGIQGLFK